jgi:hypothetical protein
MRSVLWSSGSSIFHSRLGAAILPLGVGLACGSQAEPVRSEREALVATCVDSASTAPQGGWVCGTSRTLECDRAPGTASPDVIYVVRESGCDNVELSVVPGPFPLGQTEVVVTERVATPGGGTEAREICRSELVVVDTTAPSAHPLHASMWPPNHELRSFSAAACAGLTDACDPAPAVRFTGASSDEPADSEGDGSMSPDVAFDDASTVSLRAERQGTGNGRVYSLAWSATDRSGNAVDGSCVVEVPHDASGRTAVADPIEYSIRAPED